MIVVTKAQTLAEFEQVHALIAQMGQWDVEQCDALGIPSHDVMSAYYSDDAVGLMDMCTKPASGMYIARQGEISYGCIGFVSHADTSEIIKLYVRPEGRGMGAGTLLLETALEAVGQSGVSRVRLVTVTFMAEAIALYRRFGFQECPAFEPAPSGLEEITLYMDRAMG